MPTHGSLTKAGKVRDQVRRQQANWKKKDKKPRPFPRKRNRSNYLKLLARESKKRTE